MTEMILDCSLVKTNKKTFLLDHDTGLPLEIAPAIGEALAEMDFILDEARLVKLLDHVSHDVVRCTLELIQELLSSGFLLKKSPPKTAFNRIRLHVTNRCNLRCAYCFENKSNEDMDQRVGEKAVDFLFNNSVDNEVKVIFFGGEPLLAMDQIRQIVKYGQSEAVARGRRIRFALSTNALLLTEKVLEEILAWDAGLLISYDGETHSIYRRPTVGPAGENLIKRNICRAAQIMDSERLAVAATIHHENTNLCQIIQSIVNLGVKSIKLTPEHTCRSPLSLTEADCHVLAGQTAEVLDICRAHPDISVRGYSLEVDGDGGLRYPKCCDACSGEFTVDVAGNLYPCSFFIGEHRFCLGEVVDESFDQDIVVRFQKAIDRTANLSCSRCSIRRICGGHCPYESVVLYDDLETPHKKYCALSRSIANAKIAVFCSSVCD